VTKRTQQNHIGEATDGRAHRLSTAENEEKAEVEEREGGAVVAAGLGLQEMADVVRNGTLGEFALADDARCQDGIRRSQAGGDDECAESSYVREESVDEGGGDKPSGHHHRAEQDSQGLPVLAHISGRQLNADAISGLAVPSKVRREHARENGQGDDDTGELEQESIEMTAASPPTRIDEVGAVGADGDTDGSRENRLADVEALLDVS
jgi:hypothetical protein